MSDHDHRGEYADGRHDHDPDYADKYHSHHDLEREDERLKALLGQWEAGLRELREDLSGALERIQALEDRQPGHGGPEAGDDRHQAGSCWCGDVHLGPGAPALHGDEEAPDAER